MTQDGIEAADRRATRPSGDRDAMVRPDRFLDIDRAKGFAIALVVWGHVPSAAIGDAPLWYNISIAVIYSFHMPLFMYFSGFVFFLVNGPDRFWRSPKKQIISRFDRLMVPFIFFGIVVVIGKYLASALGSVANPVNSLGSGLLDVIKNTPDNPSLSIWYLLVLFLYTVATPILWRLSRGRISLILLVGIIGWLLPLPEEFYLKRIAIYFIFFGIGGLVAIYRDTVLDILRRSYLLLILLFLVICFFSFDGQYGLILCGLAAIPAIHGLFLQKFWHRDGILLTLGRYSMAIYLLNTIFIGAAKLILMPMSSSSNDMFLVIVTVLFAIGLIGPMVIRKFLNITPAFRPIARYLD